MAKKWRSFHSTRPASSSGTRAQFVCQAIDTQPARSAATEATDQPPNRAMDTSDWRISRPSWPGAIAGGDGSGRPQPRRGNSRVVASQVRPPKPR